MICFHHNDLDGRMSAAIVRMKYPECHMYEIDYGDDFPWASITRFHVKVFMVDFSLDMKSMIKLKNEHDFVWIDHHATAIASWENAGSPNMEGVRIDGTAACILTWLYLYPEKAVPKSVTLVGKYDVWDHADPNVLLFNYGMMIKNTDPKNEEMWQRILLDINTNLIIEHGYLIKKYVDLTNVDICKKQAFETVFQGYECIAVNRMFISSYFFDSMKNIDDYYIMIMFGWSKGKWSVSLRSKIVDVARIAQKYGGGGHAGAAGFICDMLPFELK